MRNFTFAFIVSFLVLLSAYILLPSSGQAATSVEDLLRQEREYLDKLEANIAALEDDTQQEIADNILDHVTDSVTFPYSNPNQRKKAYDRLTRILAAKDDATRTNLLRAYEKAVVPPDSTTPEQDPNDPNEQPDQTPPEQSDLSNCLSQGGSWNMQTNDCALPQTPPTNKSPNQQGQSPGQSPSQQAGSPRSQTPSAFNPSSFNNSPSSIAGSPNLSGGETIINACSPQKAAKCGPSWDSRDLPKDMTPDQRAEVCEGLADGAKTATEPGRGCSQEDQTKDASERSGKPLADQQMNANKPANNQTTNADASKPRAEKTNDPKSCRALSEGVLQTYKEAAAFAENPELKDRICSKAVALDKSAKGWDECNKKPANALAEARQSYLKELQNSKCSDFFNFQIEHEVGGQGQAAQVAYIESVMNRASAGGTTSRRTHSLCGVITDPIFYKNTGSQYTNRDYSNYRGKYDCLIKTVVNQGTNTCKYCTGNSSDGVGSGHTRVVIGRETFGIEDYNFHRSWAADMKAKMSGM